MNSTTIDEVICATGNGDLIEYRITNNDGDVLATTYSMHYARLIQKAIESDNHAKAKS